jgi:hypothetical protein
LNSTHPDVSVFRRPRVTANLKYVVAGRGGLIFMADGRESTLRSQAIDAAEAHEGAKKPTEEQLRQIVEFESQIYLAQGLDLLGGLLNEDTAPLALGPENLAAGKGSRMDGDLIRTSFDSWRKPASNFDTGLQREFRLSVTRGSDLFFGRSFRISEVSGMNGSGTCASCHSSQAPSWMNIGTANVAEPKQSSDLPVFRVTCDTGRVIYTQDPGRGLISGKCADVGSFVMQQFHGLAARAPYFANGSISTLPDLVEFYQRRFNIGLTAQEKQDLVNFLRVL